MNLEKLIKRLVNKALGIDNAGEAEFVTVAQLQSIGENGFITTIDTNTAIIPGELVSEINPKNVSPAVKHTGVNYNKDFQYNPSSWMHLSDAPGLERAEPLVVNWSSGNHTSLVIDQGFVYTYELSPRLSEKEVIWDDLTRPVYEVVRNKPLSLYAFPKHSEAFVKVKEDYLKNYLKLRKKKAITVYYIEQDCFIDEGLLKLLDGKEYFEQEFEKYHIRFQKLVHKADVGRLEINGYELICNEIESTEEEKEIGHYWKGIEGIVSPARARHSMPLEYVYISDVALERFENDDSYKVYPQTGGIRYLNQWAVSYCMREGKNAIKLELKKLYEGVPYEIISHLNKFSIEKSSVVPGENIVVIAERVVRKYIRFGENLTQIVNCICEFRFNAADLITLNKEEIEHTGWQNFPEFDPVAHHINLKAFSKEQFISRCKELNNLINENLCEKPLRKVAAALGFSEDETRLKRSVKLLELIIKYLYVVKETGLNALEDKEAIVQRVAELKNFEPVLQLVKLNDLRQLDAHKNNGSKHKFSSALKAFNIDPASLSNNYAGACYKIYDELDEMFISLNDLLELDFL